jgi:signal transduction histidine kinase
MVENHKNINHLGSTEFVLLKRLSLISIFISITGLLINFFIGFSIELLLIPSISFVIYSLIFYLIIKSKNSFISKTIFTAYTIVVLNILWYYNFGSYGPAPYFFIFMFSVFLFLWEGYHLVVLSIVLAVNIVLLFLLEYFIEGFISTYSSESARIIDVYTSLFFYGAIISLLIVYARQRIVKEYKMAKQSDMLKTSFLNNISHEIRTPLNGIIGNSNMLVEYRDIDEVTQKRFVSEIKKSKDELLDNLNQILEVSSLIAGDLPIDKEKFDIKSEFKPIFQSYEKQCENKGLEF